MILGHIRMSIDIVDIHEPENMRCWLAVRLVSGGG